MRIPLSLVLAASGFLATSALAQTAAPPAPPPGGGGWMRADTNGDGVVTRAEVVAEAEARFAAMDTNKDGKVTPEERNAARAAMRDGGGQRRGGGGFGMRGGGGGDGVLTRDEAVQRAGARFDRMDANHDGRLDATELAAARPMRRPGRGGDMPPPPPAPPADAPAQ